MHIPVLLNEVVQGLQLQSGNIVLDCTLGLGGHSRQMVEKIIPEGKLIGIEADKKNLEIATRNLVDFKNVTRFYHDNFVNLDRLLAEENISQIDAVLFDLGLSSPQVDEADRGFSFLQEGPLDMRFDKEKGETAADIINSYGEKELADIFWQYGEERFSRRIAREIVEIRKERSFTQTEQLKELLERVIPKGAQKRGKHPATKVFQALRIAVNRELDVLKEALEKAIDFLAPGGRIAVISYHSLEDRITKKTFKYHTLECVCPIEIPICQCEKQKDLKIITKKPIIPSQEEIDSNPRSRSAKMRIGEKI